MSVKLREKLTHRSDSGRWDCQSLGAIIGMAGGIIVAFLGSLLTFGSWFMRGEIGRFEHVAGTVLLFLTIPLLVLGAHCLDLVERRKKGAEVAGSESRRMATKESKTFVKEGSTNRDQESG
jgi:high-affinity Fe2+/Pb2+ permease